MKYKQMKLRLESLLERRKQVFGEFSYLVDNMDDGVYKHSYYAIMCNIRKSINRIENALNYIKNNPYPRQGYKFKDIISKFKFRPV